MIKYLIYYWLLLVIIGGLFDIVISGFFAVILGGGFTKNTHLNAFQGIRDINFPVFSFELPNTDYRNITMLFDNSKPLTFLPPL